MTGNSNEGLIFNIQRYSLHDGPGIRTLIFMKGCPLRCSWCSNPESQSFHIEIADTKKKCIACGRCMLVCPRGAISPKTFDIDHTFCNDCGICAENCSAGAKSMIGTKVTVEGLMEQIEKDRLFYANSNGGVTIGGGEPSGQPEFVSTLIESCRKSHISTAVETCGFASKEAFLKAIELADIVYFDIKSMDSQKHEKFTGAGNGLILSNAREAGKYKKMVFRIPLIPGINDDEENLRATADFISGIEGAQRLEILPYHNLGEHKYAILGRPYELKNKEAFTTDKKKQLAEYIASLHLPSKTVVV